VSLLFLSLMALGCGGQEPVALPEPVYKRPEGIGRAIRHDGVHGYIARPSDRSVTPSVGVLHLAAVLNETARKQAEGQASEGKIVLSIPPTTDTARALKYLEALPGITQVSSVCYRTKC